MVEMGCQDEMVEMEPQGDRERVELQVCRDHVAHKVQYWLASFLGQLFTTC